MKKLSKKEQIDLETFEMQKDLIPLVQRMHASGEICFSSAEYIADETGNSWKSKKEMRGKFIEDFFEQKPEWVIETSKKIADDYQKVIAKFAEENPEKMPNVFEFGKRWTLAKLFTWSGPIIEDGLMEYQEILSLIEEFEKVISEKKEDFFGYAHGNIIGDHIFVEENGNQYLFGMKVIPRPGKGYYDFLRSLDWLFLKNENEDENFSRIVEAMKNNLAGKNWEEVKLVFALRCIGILGWDMIQRGDFGKGDADKKIKCLLKFIRRDY